jgi:acetyl-CoA acyltransferase 1
MALERIWQIGSHLTGPRTGVPALLAKSPDDVVVTLAIRSPMCKGMLISKASTATVDC